MQFSNNATLQAALTWGALVAAAACVPAAALAQDYPQKPVTLIVPFAAGGPTDIIARVVSDHMGRTLGQQLVVENVAGAGGTTGTDRAAKARPDGYTLLLHHSGITTAPALYSNLKYDTKTAFEPIGIINSGPMVMLGKKGLPYANLKELFDWMKADPAKVTLAHAGLGASSYFCGLILQKVLGAKFSFVTYRGTGPAMNDLVAGQIDAMCDQATSAVPQITGGTIKAYAVTGDERIGSIKDVPTTKELGFPDFALSIWTAIYAPKGTSAEIVTKLNAALGKALEDKAVGEKFEAVGTQLYPKSMWTPEALRKLYLADVDANAELLKSAGVAAQEAK